jgi:dihydroxyacid dehydratase/phosphogluconate dehydratase
MGTLRLNIPAVLVAGGSMELGRVVRAKLLSTTIPLLLLGKTLTSLTNS